MRQILFHLFVSFLTVPNACMVSNYQQRQGIKAAHDCKRPFRRFRSRLATFCAFGEPARLLPTNLGPAQSVSHVTQVFVANQQPENTNESRPPCGKELQTTCVPPGDLK